MQARERRPGRESRAVAHPWSNLEPVDDSPMKNVRIDDLVDIVPIDIRVPDVVGVDDDDRAFVTTIQAAGPVDPDLALAVEIEFLDALLRVRLHFARTLVVAAYFGRVALVAAEKNVTLVITHR